MNLCGWCCFFYNQRDDFHPGKSRIRHGSKITQRIIPLDVVMRGMCQGTVMYKIKRHDKYFKRRYHVDIQNMRLVYHPTGKPFWKSKNNIIDLYDIAEVRKGWNTDVFNEVQKIFKQNIKTALNSEIRELMTEENCFSIVMDVPRRVVNLVAPNSDTRDAWVRGLGHLLATCRHSQRNHEHHRWLAELVRKADVNNNGNLNLNECLILLRQLNIQMDNKQAQVLFDSANFKKTLIDGEDALDTEEFIRFYDSLTRRPEIEELMKKYSVSRTAIMGVEELQSFMFKEQRISLTLDECKALIEKYAPESEALAGYMSLKGFQEMLLSVEFDIFNKKHRIIHQNMNHPLNHYYVASSHNTYLLQNQLTGESSVEGYIQALLKGCRCLELDTWDGYDDEPIVYHGYTLTSRILVKDILQSIKDYAFRNSQYPVILSLENHCSVEYQITMAKHFENILGEYLYKKPVNSTETDLPSPDMLARKILIKAKKLKSEQDTEVFLLEEEQEQELMMVKSKLSINVGTDVQPVLEAPRVSGNIAHELSDLVNYFSAVRFESFEESLKTWRFYEMASFEENKGLKLCAEEAKDFVAHNKNFTSRIYPKGTRADSSNYDPIPFWNVGCQLVALNYQTLDDKMFLHDAKFSQNGGCGYILKPTYLYDENVLYDPSKDPESKREKLLLIRVISGQKLPKPNKSSEGKIVDPYVVIRVYGHPADEQKKKTRYIMNNGFNPTWNEMFFIRLLVPELSILRFSVKNQSYLSKNELLGQYALPFTSISEGYRHIHLKDKFGQDLVPSSLFVHISIEAYDARRKTTA